MKMSLTKFYKFQNNKTDCKLQSGKTMNRPHLECRQIGVECRTVSTMGKFAEVCMIYKDLGCLL